VWIEELRLSAFRNYPELRLEMSRGGVLLLGRNAQGKTNIVEAIGLLSTGISHRESVARRMVAHGAEAAGVWGRVHRLDGSLSLEVEVQGGRKSLAVNGIECDRLEEFLGGLNSMVFHAADVELVAGEPSLRRRHLNEEISKRRPRHLSDLTSYRRCVQQRNAALRRAKGSGRMPATAVAFGEELATLGERIIADRRAHVEALAQPAREIHRRLAGEDEELALGYLASAEPGCLADEIERAADDELERGVTLVGPHRDDLSVRVNDRSVRRHASRGQQKTAALAIKLAEATLDATDPAVPLLDDIMSELDGERRERLGEELSRFEQYFVTGTQKADVSCSVLDGADILTVEGGRVSRVGA
jgi:DNA replication and repair protein RecF